ncbi:MAG: flagellar basal body rod protein FlgC [Pseudomonadota bacterium]
MSDLLTSMVAASSGMEAQSSRLRLVSENLANVDTPGFRRKTISFEEVHRQGDARAVATGKIFLSEAELERVYDPAHPMAGEDGFHDGSNVDLMIEIADAREARRTYEANLRMFDQSRGMINGLFDLLRR